MSNPSDNRTVEAQSFVVKDSSGRMRARLGMQGDGPALCLYDASEKTRMVLRVVDEDVGGTVQEKEGEERVALAPYAGSGVLGFWGADGKMQALFLARADGPSLYLYDADSKVRLRIDVRQIGASLSVYDSNEKIRAELAVIEDGPSVLLSDENEQPRVQLMAGQHMTGVSIFDANGEIRAQLNMAAKVLGLIFFDADGNFIHKVP